MHSSDNFSGRNSGSNSQAPSAPGVRRTSNAFGSPGTDSTVKRLDLNDAFIRHPDATFIVRAAGKDMQGAGIDDGDVLLVDRSLSAKHGSIVIAVVDGELLCRRLEQPSRSKGAADAARLTAADPSVASVAITPDAPLEVWGVVTNVIKSLL